MQGSTPKMFREKPRSYSPLRRQLLGQRSVATSAKLAVLLLLILILSICHFDTSRLFRLPLFGTPNLPASLLDAPADSSDTVLEPASSSTTSSTTTTNTTTTTTTTTNDTPLKVALITFLTSQTSYTHLSLSNHALYASKHPSISFLPSFTVSNDRDVMWGKFDMISALIHDAKLVRQGIATGTEVAYDWIWWLDFDTLITNTSVSIAEIVREALDEVDAAGGKSENVDYIFSRDCNGLNAGSFLVRAHPRSLEFVNMIDAYYLDMQAQHKTDMLSEQDCMAAVLFPTSTHEADEDEDGQVEAYTEMLPSLYAGRFTMVPQRTINAFPEEIGCYEEAEVVSVDEEGVEVRETKEVGRWREGDFVVHMAGAWAHVKEKDATGVLMRRYAGMFDVLEREAEVEVVIEMPN